MGEITLDEVILADDEATELDNVVLDHYSKDGHVDENGDYITVSITSTESATVALSSISEAISKVKDVLTDASLTVQELDRIRGFMEAKSEKGAEFLSGFKNVRAQEIATELENLSNQLELIISMSEL